VVGHDYEMSYYLTLLLIIPVSIPLIQNVGVEIQRAKNKHQFRSVAYLIMAILNIFISIGLCHFYGPIGVALGTTLSFILCNGIVMNVYYHKKLNINVISFWRKILKTSTGLILPIFIGLLLYKIQYQSTVAYFACIAIYSVIYIISVLLFSTTKEEKAKIKQMLMRRCRKC